MATKQPNNEVTLVSGADLTTRQFRFVSMSSAGTLALTGAGARPVGVLQNAPNTGEAAEVMHSGIAKIKSGGAIDEGDLVASNATGAAVEAASGNVIIGTAVTSSTANGGEFIEVLLGSYASAA